VIIGAINGQLVSQFSLHANKVRILLDLPLQVKPCICAELPQEKIGMTSTKSYKKERSSLPSAPGEREDVENNISKKRGTSVVTKHESATCYSSHSYQPLFVSVGDGLANWFGNSDTTQGLHLLTWTDDCV